VNPLKTFLRTLTDRAATAYVAGPHLADAIELARTLDEEGTSTTLAYWNDVGDEPSGVCAAYLSAIDGAADAGIPTYLSVKAPALSLSETLVDSLARRCLDRRIGLHFDSLALEHQARTLDLIERLVPIGAPLGCTLPARFGRSLDDVERAVAHRFRVRVVKGQWEDPQYSIDPRRAFMNLIDRLAGRAAHVAVATHDPELARQALDRLSASGTPAELELLFGLPMRAARNVAQRLTVPVRVYIPYGHAWLPYAIANARNHPRVLLWLLEDAVRGRTLPRHRRP
jgi:proline dehydrogenase